MHHGALAAFPWPAAGTIAWVAEAIGSALGPLGGADSHFLRRQSCGASARRVRRGGVLYELFPAKGALVHPRGASDALAPGPGAAHDARPRKRHWLEHIERANQGTQAAAWHAPGGN